VPPMPPRMEGWRAGDKRMKSVAFVFVAIVGLAYPVGADSRLPSQELESLAGARTRVVWCRQITGEGDPFATNAWYSLMALDTQEGSERVLVPGPRSIRKPLLSPQGDWVVYTDYQRGRVMKVPFSGGIPIELADGHACDVWLDPTSGRLWVYAVSGRLETEAFLGSPVVRFPFDDPTKREVVWSKTPASTDNFQVSDDGTRAVGLFPWPQAGWAGLPDGELHRMARGCWPSRAVGAPGLVAVFDGAHRNWLLHDLRADRRWTVALNTAPDMEGAEVYHPRWGRPAHLVAVSGPYLAGQGRTRVGFGGPQVEIFVGRLADDFSKVVRWVRITHNQQADYFPDVWAVAQVPTAPTSTVAALPPQHAARSGRWIVEAKLVGTTRTPTLAEIQPYRQALVVFEYEVVRVLEPAGRSPAGRILVLHWAIRDRKPVAPRHRIGDQVRLTLEPYDAHPELEGERIVMEMKSQGRPLYYEVQP